jgi:tRNA threonylcarbamoyladenosine biosynthesis protein TsaB
MRVLALDTTTRGGSVAVVDDGRVLVERAGDPARPQAERLPSELLAALADIGGSTGSVDLFAVASGPGSFTGIRIGIATMQGLAFVHQKPAVAVPVLRALAEAGCAGLPVGSRVAAWMDAHRHDVFSALYEVVEAAPGELHRLVELEAPTSGSPAAALDLWADGRLPQAVCGDGAVLYAALVPETIAVVPPPALAGYIGRLALVAAAAGETVTAAGLQPLYVRRPDVEIARDAAKLRS